MKALNFRSAAVTVLMLCTGIAIMAASALTFEVKASRELQLAVVDLRKPAEAHEAMHRAFATGLGAAIGRRSGGPMGVQVRRVKPGEAKTSLVDGACDAVLVLGEDRPAALRRLDAITFCAMLDPDIGLQPVYLIVGNGDPALREWLAAAFTTVLADRRFLKSLENADRPPALAPIKAMAAAELAGQVRPATGR